MRLKYEIQLLISIKWIGRENRQNSSWQRLYAAWENLGRVDTFFCLVFSTKMKVQQEIRETPVCAEFEVKWNTKMSIELGRARHRSNGREKWRELRNRTRARVLISMWCCAYAHTTTTERNPASSEARKTRVWDKTAFAFLTSEVPEFTQIILRCAFVSPLQLAHLGSYWRICRATLIDRLSRKSWGLTWDTTYTKNSLILSH